MTKKRFQFDGNEYELTLEGILNTLRSIRAEFEDAQDHVPYATRFDRHIVDSRSKRVSDYVEFVEAAVKAAFNG